MSASRTQIFLRLISMLVELYWLPILNSSRSLTSTSAVTSPAHLKRRMNAAMKVQIYIQKEQTNLLRIQWKRVETNLGGWKKFHPLVKIIAISSFSFRLFHPSETIIYYSQDMTSTFWAPIEAAHPIWLNWDWRACCKNFTNNLVPVRHSSRGRKKFAWR